MKFTVYAVSNLTLFSRFFFCCCCCFFFPLGDLCHRYEALDSSDRNIDTKSPGTSRFLLLLCTMQL